MHDSILDGSTVLITGASSGLGAEYARQLAPRAKCIILAARRRARLEELAAEIQHPGLQLHLLVVDLGDAEELERFVADVQALDLEIDVLINNAGLGDHGLFDTSDWARVKAMIDVNMMALTRVTHALLPPMIVRRRGSIVNVSSIASLLPLPHLAVYAATKAYVTSLSEALRAELRETGVTVTAVCPGPVDTEFGAVADRPGRANAQRPPELFKVPAEQVVRESLVAIETDRARIIPGWLVFLTMTLTTFLPIFVVRFFLNRRGRGYDGH